MAERGLEWNPVEERNAMIVQNYLKELNQWDEAKRIATAGPVALPDAILHETLDLVRYGVFPAWNGWEKLADGAAAEDSAPPPDVAPRPAPAPRRPRTRRPSRPDPTADLF
jgi:hypothetical protein